FLQPKVVIASGSSEISRVLMNDRRTIAVDLTPLLPAATNGGAKILVLALLGQLATLAPETNFVLVTRKSSHDELEEFERANMTRKLLWNDIEEPSERGNRFFVKPAQLAAAVIRSM